MSNVSCSRSKTPSPVICVCSVSTINTVEDPLPFRDVECNATTSHRNVFIAAGEQAQGFASIQAAQRIEQVGDPAVGNRRAQFAIGFGRGVRD